VGPRRGLDARKKRKNPLPLPGNESRLLGLLKDLLKTSNYITVSHFNCCDGISDVQPKYFKYFNHDVTTNGTERICIAPGLYSEGPGDGEEPR
jgi:hypothetical protein